MKAEIRPRRRRRQRQRVQLPSSLLSLFTEAIGWTLLLKVGSIECYWVESFQYSPNKSPAHRGRQPNRKSSTSLSAHYLTTALESLWGKRVLESQWAESRSSNNNTLSDITNEYQYVTWLDMERFSEESVEPETSENDDDDRMPLPLYPLNEVYLPTLSVNHTLNNVEPQNIQMALDLLASSSPRFCVVLRAVDTGRIANVGNVLRIVDSNIQRIPPTSSNEDERIARIQLTCQSEGRIQLVNIENGSSWKENRLRRSKEYLMATVRSLDDSDTSVVDADENWKALYRNIREDIRTIKIIYQLELGAEEYPPGTLLRLGNEIRDFPEINDEDDTHSAETLLWDLAQEWQSICMTLRQGMQAILAADRNEKMVAAACASGGPLKLPIHLSDLDPEARKDVQKLDQNAQTKHEASGMDPLLDFQVLIGLPTIHARYCFLAKLVARERLRLERIASKYSSSSSLRR